VAGAAVFSVAPGTGPEASPLIVADQLTNTNSDTQFGRLGRAAIVCLVAAAVSLAGCGGSSKHRGRTATVTPSANVAPASAVVINIGATPITGATYNHWMAVGAATVERPKPDGPLPRPTVYAPPDFTACVARLREASSGSTVAELKAKCERTYEAIQRRILNFLITGYWLRGQAAEEHALVTDAEVRRKFNEEKRANYPTAGSFRRLQEASRQTVPDLEFAVETQMLSAKLLEEFIKTHSHDKSEQATIAAFNKWIRSTWAPKTECQPGYVIADCARHKP
jgi:hypothetical protein